MAPNPSEPRPGPYQEVDWDVVDYEYYQRADLPFRWRGPDPRPVEPGGYFTTLGAAQTLGRFCPHPFPSLVSEAVGLPVINLGYSGAGPSFYLKRQAILGPVNEGAFAIVQVMSGRSEGNAMMRCDSGRNLVTWEPTGEECFTERAFNLLLEGYDVNTVRAIVAETRENWLRHTVELLDAISVPTVLLWISSRHPHYTTRYDRKNRDLLSTFPHLIDAELMAAVRPAADHYVEVVSSRGQPMRLRSRFTGKRTKVRMPGGKYRSKNPAYPSAQMHEDAAGALVPVVRGLVG